jgi:hypothetical protein
VGSASALGDALEVLVTLSTHDFTLEPPYSAMRRDSLHTDPGCWMRVAALPVVRRRLAAAAALGCVQSGGRRGRGDRRGVEALRAFSGSILQFECPRGSDALAARRSPPRREALRAFSGQPFQGHFFLDSASSRAVET